MACPWREFTAHAMKRASIVWLALGIALEIPVGVTLLTVILLSVRDNLIPEMLWVLSLVEGGLAWMGVRRVGWGLTLGMAVAGAALITLALMNGPRRRITSHGND